MSAPSPGQHGRLPRPDEDLEDQGLRFDLATMFSRRRLLALAGLGVGTAVLAACGSDSGTATSSTATSSTATSSTAGTSTTAPSGSTATTASDTATLVEIPDETNGPYPADGTNGPDILEQAGVVRRDIRSSFGDASGVADGVALTFTFKIVDMANADSPYEGAAVYAWHCDAEGRYSMYSQGAEDENYLRGVQVADADGNVTFESIFPACYTGRWPHIHFEIYPDVASITDHDLSVSTSQAAFPEDACREVFDNEALYSASIQNFARLSIDDGIFDSATIDQQMLALTGDRSTGFTGTLTVPVDTTTAQSASMGGPGGGGGGPGGGGRPGGSMPAGGPPGGSLPAPPA